MKTNSFRLNLRAVCLALALLMMCQACICANALGYRMNDFDADCLFAAEVFGFDENAPLPYLPTHIDPVTYRGCIPAVGGIRDNDYYAAYFGWTESDAASYRKYPAYWGYQCALQPCEIPGAQCWVLRSPVFNPQYRFPLDEIRLYHVAQRELLVVACPYLGPFAYDIWLQSTFHSSDGKETLPLVLTLTDRYNAVIEEIRFEKELLLQTSHAQPLAPYDLPMLIRDETLMISRAENTWKLSAPLSRSGKQEMVFPCIKLSFEMETDQPFQDRLSACLANTNDEYVDCARPAFFLAEERGGMLSVADNSTKDAGIWLVFPPESLDLASPKRLYLNLKDRQDVWSGDLRQWTYLDFFCDT